MVSKSCLLRFPGSGPAVHRRTLQERRLIEGPYDGVGPTETLLDSTMLNTGRERKILSIGLIAAHDRKYTLSDGVAGENDSRADPNLCITTTAA